MSDYLTIYQSQAARYDLLIEREDYQENLLPSLRRLLPLEGARVIESGAGTGRLTCRVVPEVESIFAMDRSIHMIVSAEEHLKAQQRTNWSLGVCDHRYLPVPDNHADLFISGWSIAYLVEEGGVDWEAEVNRALFEIERIIKPGGTIVLLETLGTGFESPHPPEPLEAYLSYLEQVGFERHWLRTDYQFESQQEAEELVGFFFGPELAAQVKEKQWVILPECTGIWIRKK
ncbi:MAG: methyltransferase domain-containing protein [Anaerolineales bacterium]|nr:methyltransferase domain-containing protein [Anaerolineales bacterium]